jgi:hypothetical protein
VFSETPPIHTTTERMWIARARLPQSTMKIAPVSDRS